MNGRDPSTGQFKRGESPSVLSPKQVEIVQYIANGKRNEDIALLMNTSEAAVTNQLVRIMNLTGCSTRSAVVSWAFRRKLIS